MKPKRISYAQAAKLREFFQPANYGLPVKLAVRDSHGRLQEIQVSPPTHGELVSILHFAWCAAASPLERRAIAIAGAAIELASSDGEKDQGARLDRAHWALLGEKGNDEHIRQSLIDTVTNMRHSSEFSDETVDYCAGRIAGWFADHYCRDERLPLDLVRDVLRAPRNVGGRGKRKKPDPWHALFKALHLGAVSDATLATERSRWARNHPNSLRHRGRKTRSKPVRSKL